MRVLAFISFFAVLLPTASKAEQYPWWHTYPYSIIGCSCDLTFLKTNADGSKYSVGNLSIQAFNRRTAQIKTGTIKRITHFQQSSSEISFDEKCEIEMLKYDFCR